MCLCFFSSFSVFNTYNFYLNIQKIKHFTRILTILFTDVEWTIKQIWFTVMPFSRVISSTKTVGKACMETIIGTRSASNKKIKKSYDKIINIVMENLQVYAFTQCEGLTPVVCALKADLATPLLISASGNRQMWYLTSEV